MRYAFNILNSIISLVPHFLRGDQLILFLYVLCKPIETLHNVFLSFVVSTRMRVQYTGQVFSLEKILNDTFDPSSRGIQIVDGVGVINVYLYPVTANVDGPYMYNSQETAPQEIFLYFQDSESIQQADFIVRIPLSLVYDELQLRGLVNAYKMAGKRYKLETYSP